MNEVLTLQEISEELKISEPSVKKLIMEQGLPYFKVGNLFRFNRPDFETWKIESKKIELKECE